MTIESQVAAGLQFLLEKHGEQSVRGISIESLDVENPWACPLAQASGQYYNRVFNDIMLGREFGYEETIDWMAQHGFALDRGYNFATLNAEWKRVLTEYQATTPTNTASNET
jgi:hypothetical protein